MNQLLFAVYGNEDLSRPYVPSLAINRLWGKQLYAFDRFISIVPMNTDLSSSFCHACSNLKRACCVEWALQNPQSSLFGKFSNKYEADQTLFSRITEVIRFWCVRIIYVSLQCWELRSLGWTSGLTLANSTGFSCTKSAAGRLVIPFFFLILLCHYYLASF